MKWVFLGESGENNHNHSSPLMPPENPVESLFAGTYARSLDAKHRVAVPSAWVRDEGTEFFVIPHPEEGYLMLMPPGEFHSTEQRILGSSASPQEKRQAIRQFFSAAHRVVSDKQGRILLQENHAAAADLSGEIVFIGAGRRFEIWSKDRHEAANTKNTEIYRRVAVEIGL
jgi:MraZ protein